MTGWCILKMSGPRTLAVVKSLREAGFDVWTPTSLQRRFKPRSTKYTDIEIALLPTFAFARAGDLPSLLRIVHAPVSAHPRFSILHHGDRIPTATDAALQPLRDYEADVRASWEGYVEAQAKADRRKRKKSNARAYVLGQRVRVRNTAFAGLVGEIAEIRKTGDLVLQFTGFTRGATVSSCDVHPVKLSDGLSERDEAA